MMCLSFSFLAFNCQMMNKMAWEIQCSKLFRQHEEILIVFNDSLQMFEDTINTLELCIDFKDYDDFNY